MKLKKIHINTSHIIGKVFASKIRYGIFYSMNLVFIILVIVFFTTCEESYWPELDGKYQDLLVIEGMITNNPGPYILQLSKSTSVDDPEYSSFTNCEAVISDDQGNSELLSEVEPGNYYTAIDGIQGVVGRKYKITIQSPEGKTYESDFEELLEPIEIDTVFVELEYRENPDFPFDIPGYQFLLNTKIGNDNVNYFLWQLEQTFEYNADYLIFFMYNGSLHIFSDPDLYNTCWITNSVNQIFTGSSFGLSEPVLANFTLHYVSFDTREMSVRYSLLVEQFTITEKAQDYWEKVNDQNTSGGELYSRMPFQVRGNLSNINDPNEPVLGYFHAAGIDTKRIYLNRPTYPVEMFYPVCELNWADYEEYGWMFVSNDPRDWPRYVTMNSGGQRAVPTPVCVDCRESGGTIEKPDFWID